MDKVKALLEVVDPPGGHILIGVGMLVAFSQFVHADVSHDVVVFALGVLARSMGTSK